MGDDSVLERLELAGRRVPHLRLREETEPAAPPPTGTPGRFEVLGELGRGGIGAVYLSRDRDLGRTVAVKKLLDRHLSSRDIRRRFVGEARIGGRLDHPGVVPIYEVGLEEGRRPFIAMKVVKGRTLAEILDDREGPEDDRRRVLDVFRRVCETVAYAHSRGIVHRDLKPANVMVGTFGEIAVLDWGLAKVLAPDAAGTDDPATDPGELPSGAAEISQDGLVLGTLAY
ncbi:MAG: serine/threonine protein kinase, partial [Planctomycetes bacterium]|nr:serine/threonine protein kinase [Planctomycetota bacterium]